MMRKLSIIISVFCLIVNIQADDFQKKSPHGENFKLECTKCHSIEKWTKIKTTGFDHNTSKFPLIGQHKSVYCRSCHTSLVFTEAKKQCYQCHTDVHQGTTGKDCERCHTNKSWIVTNTRTLHQQAGFPLKGSHQTLDCNRCHTGKSTLLFQNMKTECFDCHKDKYYATAGKPFDHKALGFDTECVRCHSNAGMDWNTIGKGFDHSFFPKTGAHNVSCNSCHTGGDFRTKLSSDCNSCHSHSNKNASAIFPAHSGVFAKYTCIDCHSPKTWNTVKFKQHDALFPIYSGNHKGKWTTCTDCHTNDAVWDAKNSCKKCHDNNPEFKF